MYGNCRAREVADDPLLTYLAEIGLCLGVQSFLLGVWEIIRDT